MERPNKRKLPPFVKALIWMAVIVYGFSGIIIAVNGDRPFHGWIFYWDGPYKGRVVDRETGNPIEGVVVAGAWHLQTVIGLAWFCDAVETKTDKNGEFTLRRAWCISLWPIAELRVPGKIAVFKGGYLGYPPLGNTQEEREQYLPGWINERYFGDPDKYNVLRLGRPQTKDERIFTSQDTYSIYMDKLPMLRKAVEEDDKIHSKAR